MNRGSDRNRIQALSSFRASMRPRFMNRGSAPRDRVRRAASQASMRPRFMNRGSKPIIVIEKYGQVKLQ